MCAGDHYEQIVTCLKNVTTIAYLNFVVFLGASLTGFLVLFQKSEPLIHVLVEKLNKVLRLIMFKFIKAKLVDRKFGNDLLSVDCDNADGWLPYKFDVGIGTRFIMSESPGSEKIKQDG